MAPKKRDNNKAPKAAATPSGSSGATKPPASPARPLTPRARLLLMLALPLCVAGFTLGAAGLVVLIAPDGAPEWLSPDSSFAAHWRVVLHKNMFVQPFLFNFGAIATLGCAMRLAEGFKADQQQAAAAAGGKKRR
jgi:hypothetical protein